MTILTRFFFARFPTQFNSGTSPLALINRTGTSIYSALLGHFTPLLSNRAKQLIPTYYVRRFRYERARN